MFWGCFCLGIWGVLDIKNSAQEKSYSIQYWGTLAKLRVPLRIYLTIWDIEVFRILIEKTNSEHSCKVRYSGKDFPNPLGNWSVPLWWFLVPLWWFLAPGKMTRISRPEVFCKKGVLENFAKFTGKHRCQSLLFNKFTGLRPATFLKKRLWHRCFPVNFVKYSRTPVFIEHLPKRLLNDGILWQASIYSDLVNRLVWLNH